MELNYINDIESQPIEIRSIDQIIQEIRQDQLREITANIRSAPDKAERNRLKRMLPAFRPCVQSSGRRIDGGAEATGIIQFDLDKKVLDCSALKSKITQLPETAYAFISPSGMLKFGILSDFSFDPKCSLDNNLQRFQHAYDHADAYVHEVLNVEFDRACRSISQLCFLSHDPDAYFNPTATPLKVNAFCDVVPTVQHHAGPESFSGDIGALLGFIPKDHGYADRLPINMAVLGHMGEEGIALLSSHWTTDSRGKLANDLQYQLHRSRSGWLGTLVNAAKRHGWNPAPKTSSRRNQKALPSTFTFPPLLSQEDASEKLRSEIDDFFQNQESKIVKSTCGFGKTEFVLRALAKLPATINILFLVQNHGLIDELRQRLSALIVEERKSARPGSAMSTHVAVRGKAYKFPNGRSMCENTALIEKFGSRIPSKSCFACPFAMECTYTEQFNNLANIRFATFEELYDNQSRFWHGTHLIGESIQPRRQGFTPQYIIIDENCIRLEICDASRETEIESLQQICDSCIEGKSIVEACRQAGRQLKLDYGRLMSQSAGDPTKTQQLLELLHQFLQNETSEQEIAAAVRFTGGKLRLRRVRPVASRYRETPTLILDATAEKEIYQAVFPKLDFVDIPVAVGAGNRVFQVQNFNVTRQQLSIEKRRTSAAEQLQRISGRYASVGLITYRKIPHVPSENFDSFLASQIKASQNGYFGNIRGTNAFANVDCLIIFGRHRFGDEELQRYAEAIYGAEVSLEKEYANVPVRMADGTAKSLSNFVFKDARIRSVYRQFCTSESVQAVGRGRLFHGRTKDVYIFSNESLGAHVGITDFIDFEYPQFSEINPIPADTKIFQDKRSELVNLGFSDYHIKTNHDEVVTWILEQGFDRYVVKYMTEQYKKKEGNFFARGEPDIRLHFGPRLRSVEPVPSTSKEVAASSEHILLQAAE